MTGAGVMWARCGPNCYTIWPIDIGGRVEAARLKMSQCQKSNADTEHDRATHSWPPTYCALKKQKQQNKQTNKNKAAHLDSHS